jgi:hypothetical protein
VEIDLETIDFTHQDLIKQTLTKMGMRYQA